MKRVYTHTHVKFYLSFCSALVLLAKMYESQKILYNKNETDPTYTKKNSNLSASISPFYQGNRNALTKRFFFPYARTTRTVVSHMQKPISLILGTSKIVKHSYISHKLLYKCWFPLSTKQK